jgi:hypothetical protein
MTLRSSFSSRFAHCLPSGTRLVPTPSRSPPPIDTTNIQKKNKIKISKVLHDLEECIVSEMYTIPENINDDDGDIIDTTIKDMQSKYNLVNTSPDFGKVEDPFYALGPITVFSARRIWTAPRCVRLHKTDYQTKNCGTEEFGFALKGDAPAMVCQVDINSVADVRCNSF